MKSKKTGINRIIKAFAYSWDGLRAVFKTEVAFRQEVFLCVLGVIVQFFIDVPMLYHILMVCSLGAIILAELTNSAIETIIDRIGSEYNNLSKRAKDIGSAIVMLTIVLVAILWIALIFLAA